MKIKRELQNASKMQGYLVTIYTLHFSGNTSAPSNASCRINYMISNEYSQSANISTMFSI